MAAGGLVQDSIEKLFFIPILELDLQGYSGREIIAVGTYTDAHKNEQTCRHADAVVVSKLSSKVCVCIWRAAVAHLFRPRSQIGCLSRCHACGRCQTAVLRTGGLPTFAVVSHMRGVYTHHVLLVPSVHSRDDVRDDAHLPDSDAG